MKTSLVFVIAALIGLVCFSEAFSLKNRLEHGQRSFEEALEAKLGSENLEKLKSTYGVASIEELKDKLADQFVLLNLHKFPALLKPVPAKEDPSEARSDLANFSLKKRLEHGQRSFGEVLEAKLGSDNLEKLKGKYGVTSIEELKAVFAEKFQNLNKFPDLLKPVPAKVPLDARSNLANDDQDSEEDEDDEDSSEEDEDYSDEDEENSRIAEKKSDENEDLSDEDYLDDDYSDDDFSPEDYSEEDEDDSNEAGEENDFDDGGKGDDE